MKPKFQPRPRRIRAAKKWVRVTPRHAVRPANPRIRRPAVTIRCTPKRAMRWPVTNDGAYIARTWAETMSLALSLVKPQPMTASGVEVITRLISEYATVAQMIATSTVGSRRSSRRDLLGGNRVPGWRLGGTVGRSSNQNRTMPPRFRATTARYVPTNGMGRKALPTRGQAVTSATSLFNCGPNKADRRPPAST